MAAQYTNCARRSITLSPFLVSAAYNELSKVCLKHLGVLSDLYEIKWYTLYKGLGYFRLVEPFFGHFSCIPLVSMTYKVQRVLTI